MEGLFGAQAVAALALPWTLPLAMLVTGFLSGVHCLGMCGGIVGAFSAQRVIAITPVRALCEWPRQLAFNAGRLVTYTLLGAVAGTLGNAGGWIAGVLPWQSALYVLANVMLILVGLHLAGLSGWLGGLERVGAPLWRRIQPLAARLLPGRTLGQGIAAGLAWGLLPCGLVYGALAAAAFAGGPLGGAVAMLAFGLGTLPNLLAAGLAAARLRGFVSRRGVRLAAGGLVLGFGVFGLAHAGAVAEGIRRGLLCL
ncbi:MAG: sulfite exporter TauE/SafE family protein [Proteobacteria bacterium]|nr:sulfite exporter TauE/SafE family protein [Pseudomonadota bacterium]